MVDELREDVEFYKKKIVQLEHQSGNYGTPLLKNEQIVDQYNYKIREKGL